MTNILMSELMQLAEMREQGMSVNSIARELHHGWDWVNTRLVMLGDKGISTKRKDKPRCACCEILLQYASPADDEGRCQYCQEDGWRRVDRKWVMPTDKGEDED